MRGKVKWFSEEKGYGFITGEDGKDVFAHVRNTLEGEGLSEGQTVEFAAEQGPKGPRAINIRVITMLLIVISAMLLAPMAGCTSAQIEQLELRTGQLEQAVSSTRAALDVAMAQKATVDQLIATLPAGEARDKAVAYRDRLVKFIEQSQEILAQAEPALASLKASLANAQDETDVAQGFIGATAPLVPQPWGALLVGVGTAVIGIWRAVKAGKKSKSTEAAAAGVIAAIDAAKTPDGTVNFADPAVAKILDAVMGKAGKALVDQVQKGQ